MGKTLNNLEKYTKIENQQLLPRQICYFTNYLFLHMAII